MERLYFVHSCLHWMDRYSLYSIIKTIERVSKRERSKYTYDRTHIQPARAGRKGREENSNKTVSRDMRKEEGRIDKRNRGDEGLIDWRGRVVYNLGLRLREKHKLRSKKELGRRKKDRV